MASSRVLNQFLKQRRLLLFNLPTASSCSFRSPLSVSQAPYATAQKAPVKTEQSDSENKVQVGFAETVKENTKSAWYLSIIVGGVGLTGFILFTIFKELFSDKSPNGIYKKALERCLKDSRILDALGEPVKAYGEETRRGRRGHVRHNIFLQNEVQHIRMQFYIQGIRKRGVVHLEVYENPKTGNFEYKYLFVKLEDMLRTVIVLEDDRNSTQNTIPSGDELLSPI